MKNQGFSLFELITVLAVICITLALGAPSLLNFVYKSKTQVVAYDLLHSLELARTKAVSTNTRVVINNKGDWSKGWQVFADKNNNGKLDSDESLYYDGSVKTNVNISSTATSTKNYVSYIGSGESRVANGTSDFGAFQATTFKVCSSTQNTGYLLLLARGGRVRITTATTNDCKQS